MPLTKGIPFEQGREREVPPKLFRPSVESVSDRHTHAAYHNKQWWQGFRAINDDDLERP